MRQQRKDGAEGAFGPTGAAGKVQNQRPATDARDVPSDAADASAQSSVRSVPSALLPQQLGNPGNKSRADSKRGLRCNVAWGKSCASGGQHQGCSAGSFAQGRDKAIKLIRQHQRIEHLCAGVGKKPGYGRP
jgi:hypothetical protein